MSARGVERALARLAAPRAILAREPRGAGFGVYLNGDRRRRAVVRVSAEQVRLLAAEGALDAAGADAYALSEAGRARARREAAAPTERFAAQHRPIVDREIVDAGGEAQRVRGYDGSAVLRRLSALRDGGGAPWLSSAELSAAAKLRADWEASQGGLVRGSDWTAPPRSGSIRGLGNAQEAALARRCDSNRRMNEALDALAAPLRRVLERIVLHEEGVETLERQEGWPARSGKIGLKLALAQLASRPF